MADDMAVAINTKTLVIDSEILDLVAELDEFKGAWRALSTLPPDRLSALRRVATIESIGSSTRIEGNKLSDRDVEKLLSVIEIQTFSTRDEQEVACYAAVMETIFTSWSVLTLTENQFKQIHGDLLRYSTKDKRHRGEYKKLDNHVVAFDAKGKSVGIVFQTASPFDTPRLMTQLVEWISETLARRTLHPLVAIAVFIVLFLQIHPFQRTQKTTRTRKPDWQPWVLFFLRALQKQKRRLEIKVDREKKILGQLPELSLRIFELAKDRGQIKVEDVLRATGAPRATVKDHLKILIQSGYLLQHGKGKGTWYSVG